MKISILTIFPKMIESYINESIIKKAIIKKAVKINVVDIREFSDTPHKQVDDYPYGGGAGMLLMIDPIVKAINSVKTSNSILLLTSPQGKPLDQATARNLAVKKNDLIIICGHYEGIDARITHYIDQEISIGNYVLTGGELSALVIVDAIVRLIDGVIKPHSHLNDSFENNLLDYDSYTKPFEYDSYKVPDVLTSGHHKNIEIWKRQSQLKNTYLKKPQLLEFAKLTTQDLEYIKLLKKQKGE